MVRVGIGFDAHRFAANRRLVLGGVTIPFELGLLGHSDADVLCHAVADALLGAVAAGDIGKHFPDNDPAWRDADSLVLLKSVVEIVRSRRFRVGNVDATIVAEKPRLAAYIDAMRANLGEALGIPPAGVSVKATTVERMGAIGREEGIAAMAVAAVEDEEQDRA